MRLNNRQSGIISYAGLDENALWAAAKRALAQADEETPERFSSFLPIFPVELIEDMPYIGSRTDNRSPVSPQGFSIDPTEYHQRLCEEMPELYTGDNYRRNFNYDGRFVGRGAVTVDEAWATRFAQYQPFMGERLHIYMIGGGHQAVAVPESLYPRGGAMLRNLEIQLRVKARCDHYVSYLKRRIAAGDRYDTALYESDYLRINGLAPVNIPQSELGRVLQDLSILRDLNGEKHNARLFTENAKRAEGIAQYAPYRCACDGFAPEPITRSTARLMQLYYEDDGRVGDLWLPYQDASEYLDKRRMALDVSALCHGFQLAPTYDPVERSGRYPGQARVAIVRDRDTRPMVAGTINNPAYGGGMSPLGMTNRLVYLRDSQELLRQGRLTLETTDIVCENTRVPLGEYRDMVVAATAQEVKGRLIDAMYRRESALKQMEAGTRAYERARELLDQKVEALSLTIERLGVELGTAQLSGYDADIDYLRRMALAREGLDAPQSAEGAEVVAPAPFMPDALREASIESGYAMRNGVRRVGLGALEDGELEALEAADEDADAADGADAYAAGAPDDAGGVSGNATGAPANTAAAPSDAIDASDMTDPTTAPNLVGQGLCPCRHDADESVKDNNTNTPNDADALDDMDDPNDTNDPDNGTAASEAPESSAKDKSPIPTTAREPIQFEQLRMFGDDAPAVSAPSGVPAKPARVRPRPNRTRARPSSARHPKPKKPRR